jgi:hypothetical protein
VHGDVVGQRPQVVQTVQDQGEQRGVVAVGTGQDTAQGNPVPVSRVALLPSMTLRRSVRSASRASAASGAPLILWRFFSGSVQK